MGAEAILLAAGESSRMGRAKALLEWFGQPLALAQTESLMAGGADRVVEVTGIHHEQISKVVSCKPQIVVVNNADWASGKTTSIKTGLNHLSEACDTIIVLAVDQPRPDWAIERTLQSHITAKRAVTSPRYDGHGGHPLVFDISIIDELNRISEQRAGLREIMNRYEEDMNRVLFENPVVRFDLNTPDDYAAALESYPSLASTQ